MSPRPHSWRRAERRLACALVLAAAGAAAACAGVRSDVAGAGARRLVAIGDIHGAFNGVREILRKVELIDHKDRWVGGDAVLVQTGDFLDRGPGATKVARLLMDLQRQAPEQGGEVIVLLGNHEILNLLGDLRDVTKHILGHHVDGHSEKRLTVACNAYAAYHRRLYGLRGKKAPKRRELLEQCLAEQHLGLVEYLKEIGPGGELGRWLRTLPAVARVGDVVFVHGGISGELADRALEQINREVRLEIKSFDLTRQRLIDMDLILPTSGLPEVVSMVRRLAQVKADSPSRPPLSAEMQHVLLFNDWLSVREDGPLWFRGYAQWTEEEGEARMPAILKALDAGHVVVGHTPQAPYRIRSRFDSHVFLIDTGMLTSVYDGHPSALEIQDGSFTAFYLTNQSLLHEQRAVAQAR